MRAKGVGAKLSALGARCRVAWVCCRGRAYSRQTPICHPLGGAKPVDHRSPTSGLDCYWRRRSREVSMAQFAGREEAPSENAERQSKSEIGPLLPPVRDVSFLTTVNRGTVLPITKSVVS